MAITSDDNPILYDYEPQPRQQLLHNTTARQTLYGGAAGGGKSRAVRADLVSWCLEVPGIETYLFRRTFSELDDNHIRPMLKELSPEIATHHKGDNAFVFKNGSRINFCHCADPDDYLKYQGAEFHILVIDEASLFLPNQIIELRSRIRLGSFASAVPPHLREFLPRLVMTSNPGGPSHSFLKQTFMDGKPVCQKFYDKLTKDPSDPNSKGWTSIFIPAKMADNKFLDDGYGAVFSAMAPERAKALREGDWDVVAGAALFSLDRQRHMVKSFAIPKHWTRFAAIDWGTAAPFSVVWFAVVGEDTLVNNNSHIDATEYNPKRAVYLPEGALIAYNEYYGCEEDKPNTGLRLDSATVALEIVTRERERKDEPMDCYVIDSAAMNSVDGPSVAERMADTFRSNGHPGYFKPSTKNRANNYNEILSRLSGNPNYLKDGYKEKHPMLFITENCAHAWRTLPPLQLDRNQPEKGPDSKSEDHWYDSLQYAVASRPFITTKADYIDRHATFRGNGSVDPYSSG